MAVTPWVRPSQTGGVIEQRRFGRKIGHVLRHGKTWIALLDGVVLGKFKTAEEAREAVDSAGGIC